MYHAGVMPNTDDANIEQLLKHADSLVLTHQRSTQHGSVQVMISTPKIINIGPLRMDGFCGFFR